eukprot:jgi/Chrzof1/9949/Cz04g21230.t1
MLRGVCGSGQHERLWRAAHAHRQPANCYCRRHTFSVTAQAKGFGAVKLPGKAKDLSNGRPLLTPRIISPPLPVPDSIPKPPYAASGMLPPMGSRFEIHDAKGLEGMRAAGKLAARVLQHAGSLVQPGITTDEIDRAVHQMITDHGAYPSPLNYGKFPKSVCTSVNECVCHGIPDDRPLADGDIINIDVTVYLNGYHGDCSAMFYAGNVSDKAKRLCEVTKLARDEAIKVCGPGVRFAEIGNTCQAVAEANKVSVVKDFIGHGVGKVFHAMPQVFHTRNNEGGKMQVNQTFTIEPIFAEGNTKLRTWADKWTVVTADGGLAAQWEHTILITENGAEILTQC